MADANQGAQARLLVEPGSGTATFDVNSEATDFLRESVRAYKTIIQPNGIRGTRSRPKEITRAGPYEVHGMLAFNPSPLLFDTWLPRILGAAEATDVFNVAEAFVNPEGIFALLLDKKYDIIKYEDCYVNRALLRGRSHAYGDEDPQPIELIIELVGKTETTGQSWPGTPPSISVATNAAPYIFEDAATGLSYVGGTENFIAFELLINNHLEPRWTNSLTATSITPRDREVTLKLITPATSDESGLYPQAATGTTGSLTFTNGTVSCVFSFGVLQSIGRAPIVEGKQEIVLPLENFASKSGSTAEITVTNDSVV